MGTINTEVVPFQLHLGSHCTQVNVSPVGSYLINLMGCQPLLGQEQVTTCT